MGRDLIPPPSSSFLDSVKELAQTLAEKQRLAYEREKDAQLQRAASGEGDGMPTLIQGETLQQLMLRGMNHLFARSFFDDQNEAGVRRRIERGDFKYAVKLMKAWFGRKPEDVEILRQLKAEMIEARTKQRDIKALYARRGRAKKRAARAAEDTRLCPVCRTPLAGKRAGATTCGAKCRMAKMRTLKALTEGVRRYR